MWCGGVVGGDCWASTDGVRVEEVGGVGSCAGGCDGEGGVDERTREGCSKTTSRSKSIKSKLLPRSKQRKSSR